METEHGQSNKYLSETTSDMLMRMNRVYYARHLQCELFDQGGDLAALRRASEIQREHASQ